MDTDDRAQFGRYLHALRVAKKLSLRELAGRTQPQVGTSYLSQIENGQKGPPSKEVLRGLAKVLGVPVAELFKRAGTEDDAPESKYNEDDLRSAWAYVLSDQNLQVGAKVRKGQKELPPETKLYIIRLVERVKGVKLLPEIESKEGNDN